MTGDTDTIDWDAFWREAEGDRRASAHVGQFGKADLLQRFFEETTVPDSFASFGCGPAAVPFELADTHPEMDVFGYDAAESVVAENRERARGEGVDNLRFGVERLPEIGTDRAFDLVYCYSTLHYVRDVERAVENLHDRVAPGGYLVFNYPNSLTKTGYQAEFEDPEPRERFALVLDGENLLSYRRIEEVLGTRPRSYWSAVDAPDEPWTDRHNPCVYVRA